MGCYPATVGVPFVVNRIEDAAELERAVAAYRKCKTVHEPDAPLYSTLLHKFDRSSYRHKRDDIVILSPSHIRVFSAKGCKLKQELTLVDLVKISVSRFNDGVIVISTPGKQASGDKLDKGDFIFDTPHAIELATMIIHTLAVRPHQPTASPLGERMHGVTMPRCGEKLKIGETLEPILKGGKVGKIVFGIAEDEYSVVQHEGAKALKVTAPDIPTKESFKAKVRRSMRDRAKE